jgi:hypothetical protein
MAAGTPPAVLLESLIEHSRLPLPLREGRLAGVGGERWRTLAAHAAHVVFGEEHGNQGIARVAQAMWADLAQLGWRHAAIEADPWVAAALQRELRGGGIAAWANFLQPRGGATAVPFFGWHDEAGWAAVVPQLWGLDQVFVGSAGWLLRDLLAQPDAGLDAAGVSGSSIRREVAALADEAQATPDWLGRVDPARLLAVAAGAASGSPARQLLEAMAESAQVYAPFTRDLGEPTLANARREQAMKRAFAAEHRRAEAAEGRAPRVFVKVGAYHGLRGATPTAVQGLGGFVGEWAAARGQAVLTVLVLCGPGSRAATHGGAAQPCDGWVREGDWRFLRPHLDPAEPTMFDLRSWRLRPRRLQQLPAEVQRMVGSYDLLVFVPASPAASVLAMPPPPRRPPTSDERAQPAPS